MQNDITALQVSLTDLPEDMVETDPDRLSAEIAERSAARAANEDELREISVRQKTAGA